MTLEEKQKEIDLRWADLDNAVKMRDFGLMMRRYWVLYYTLWPERRKNKAKTPEKTIDDAGQMLTPDEARRKMDEIGELFRVKPPEKAE